MTIDKKAFASLVLDFEFDNYISCRILIEDCFYCRIRAKDKQEAIEIFRSGKWK